MPNYITNQLSFGTDKAAVAAFQRMAEEMRVEGEFLGTFDFNKLLPMPAELNITAGTKTERGLELYRQFIQESEATSLQGQALSESEREELASEHLEKWTKLQGQDPEMWSLGEKAYQNIQKYGSPTWYEWCNKNWGTKWNAGHCVQMGPDSDTMQFLTAWGGVPNLIKLLSAKYPDQKISYRWADEDIGTNVGERVFQGGEEIEANIPPAQSREAYELAAEIMGLNLADYDLYLTEDKSGYQYLPGGPKATKGHQKEKKDRSER